MTQPEEAEPTPSELGPQDSDTLRRAIALVKAIRNPSLPGLVFQIGLVIAGVGALIWTVFAVAGTPYVPLQMPFVVSGGFVGVAFMASGAVLAAIQSERHDRVQARIEMQEAVDELSALVRAATYARQR